MKKFIKPLLILLVLAAVFVISYCGAHLGMLNRTKTAAETAQPLEANQNIVIAGYDVLSFEAQQTEQNVYFYNSDRNKCFIVISLIVGGKELYTSDMIAPNSKIDNISLSEPLAAGVYYDAIIRYSCYDLYTQRELNGADIAVKLEVE